MQGYIYTITEEEGKSVIEELWESIYSLGDRVSYLESEITKYVTLDRFESEISRIDASLANKQETLVSGENIKTLNGESLLDSGNIEIKEGVKVFDLPNLHASDSIGMLYSYTGDVQGAIVHLGEFSFQNFSIERFVDWDGSTKYKVSLSTFGTPNKSFSNVSFSSSTWLQYLYGEAKGIDVNGEGATKFVTALPNRAGFGMQTIGVSDVQGLSDSLNAKADLIDGKVPVGQLPSSLDDVREYDSLDDMPQEGESDVIYIAKDTNKQYRYDATDGYVELSPNEGLEVIEHQTTTPLTDTQIAKALAGKLAVLAQYYSNSKVLMIPYDIYSNVIRFVSSKSFGSSMANVYFSYVESATYYSVELNVSTKLFGNVIQSGRSFLASNQYNVFDVTETPDVSGKQIARARNLRKTQNMMAPVYDSTATYSEGDYVIYQNDFYKCTTAITVAEAWSPAHWAKSSLSEMLDDIHTASELEILRLFREECTITSNITNGSASGDSTIWTEETASVTIMADSGYILPNTISVTGASFTYDNATGVVSLSGATGAVAIIATCPPMPVKGDIITLDGGTARYRVLKTSGTIAEVLALNDVANSAFNGPVETIFSDGSVGLKYENSVLDTYMNSTFYNSLSSNIKAAIVQKSITQSMYKYNTSEISGYDFAMTSATTGVISETSWYKRIGQVSVGNRYCYALDLDDVAEYLGAGSGNTVSGADLNDMFFERTPSIKSMVWLDSAYKGNSSCAYNVHSELYIVISSYYDSRVVRPAFQVDLTNLAWAKESNVPEKGDIITLDGGSARYRVLGVSGSETLLLAMNDYANSAYNLSNVTKTFDGGKTGQKYEGSTLDNLLNTTYYNSLSSNVRNAIVDQTRIQRMYSYKNPDDPSYDYHQQYNFDATFDATEMDGLQIEDQTTVGSRHVFALDIKDIFDYLGKNTMTSAELNDMFFEQTTAVSKHVWLSSATSEYPDCALDVYGDIGYVDNYASYYSAYVVRPAFQVDLSNLSWAKEE